MQKIVLDTNVLLVSISERSRVHWIFRRLLAGDYRLCVTTDILAEYAEIVELHMGVAASQATLGALENLPNVELTTSYYRFHLLADEDDNKFVDCAVAANADFIVSHDRDFQPLAAIRFPAVRVVDSETFGQLLTADAK